MEYLTKAYYYNVNSKTPYQLDTPTTLLLSVDTYNQYRHACLAEEIHAAVIGEIKFFVGEMCYFMVIHGG